MNSPNKPHAHASAPDPYLLPALGVAVVVIFTLPVIIALASLGRHSIAAEQEQRAVASVPAPLTGEALGAATFQQSCVVCHGPNAEGVPGLGKPIRNSAFVQSATDDELFNLIVGGRAVDDAANTTGVAMPPRAGNPALTDASLHAVVSYVRTLQDPNVPTASIDPWTNIPHPSHEASTETAIGQPEFIASCSACHGRAGEGLDGLGKPLAKSEFVRSRTDKEMMTFIKTGRPIWDAANTTGVDMPAKGGNPALSDDDMLKIVQYIRSLQVDG